ncbi:MAG: hypothetical protein BWK76_27830 [Desulfobulbaceae bacterium A2]|nr:MAG: hypothetical protein BWK76_27830 [Desulfobulbaceae bacterium A2]
MDRGKTSALLLPLLCLLLLTEPGLAETTAQTGADQAERAQRITEGPVISELVAFALEHNPSLTATRQGWRAAVEGYRVARAYPDPRLSLAYPVNSRIGDEEWNVALSQGIPFPGRLNAEGGRAEAGVRLARTAHDKAVRELTVKVRQTAHELIYLRQAAAISAANQALLHQVLTAGTGDFARERTALIDLAKAGAQAGQLRYDEQLLGEQATSELARLNALLGRPPAMAIGPLSAPPVLPLVYSLEELYTFVAEAAPEVLLAQAARDKAERALTVARYATLPSFEVGVYADSIKDSAPTEDNARTGLKTVGATLSLTLPLWFDKNEGLHAEARAKLEQAKAEVAARINEARAETSRLAFRLHNAERLIRLYREELLPRAAGSMETAETWFREGKGGMGDYTETRTVWNSFQLALARAVADQGQSLAALEGITGRVLTEAAVTSGAEP